jgi:hypothetical protein
MMETSELLRQAWKAVKESQVPESMQEAAFHEAVEHLRSAEGAAAPWGAVRLETALPADHARARKPGIGTSQRRMIPLPWTRKRSSHSLRTSRESRRGTCAMSCGSRA